MVSRRSLAKAYVQLMSKYPADELAAAMAPLVKSNNVDADLLARDISSEILSKNDVLTGTLSVAHEPSAAAVSQIETELRKLVNAQDVHLDVQTNPDLIGGFVAQTPAGTVDASVIKMLDKLEVA